MTITEEEYKKHRIIIYSIIAIFQFVGFFGNINLIVLTYRKRSLRSKYGYLLAILATLHTFCLFFEYINMGFGLTKTYKNITIHRNICFYAMFPYIFVHSLQTGTICCLSFDLLLTITVPIKYRTFDVFYYFLSLFSLPLFYGLSTVITGFVELDHEVIQMCNPPSALYPTVNANWYACMLAFSMMTVIFYLGAFGSLFWKIRKRSEDLRMIEKKAMKTLQVLVVVFLFTRFLSTALFNILTILKIDPDTIILVQNYNIIAGVVAYSQNAYVCFARSAEYRQLLLEQLSLYHPKINSIIQENASKKQSSKLSSAKNVLKPMKSSTSQISRTRVVKHNS